MSKKQQTNFKLRKNSGRDFNLDWIPRVDGESYAGFRLAKLDVVVAANFCCEVMATEIIRDFRAVWARVPGSEKESIANYVSGCLELEFHGELLIGNGRKCRQITACDHADSPTLQFNVEKICRLDRNNVRFVLAHELAHKLQDSRGLDSIGPDSFVYLARDPNGSFKVGHADGDVMTREEIENEADAIAARWGFRASVGSVRV